MTRPTREEWQAARSELYNRCAGEPGSWAICFQGEETLTRISANVEGGFSLIQTVADTPPDTSEVHIEAETAVAFARFILKHAVKAEPQRKLFEAYRAWLTDEPSGASLQAVIAGRPGFQEWQAEELRKSESCPRR